MKVSQLVAMLNSVEGDPDVKFLSGHGELETLTEHNIANSTLEADGRVYLYDWVDDPTPRLLIRV